MEIEANRYNQEEVSLKELILNTRSTIQYLWQKKYWIIVFAILGGIGGLYKAFSTPETYTAELTYMVNEDDGGSMGGVGAILGQFGLGGAIGGEYNLNKIIELSYSRKILESVILDSINIRGEDVILGNYLIDLYDLHSSWRNRKRYELDGFYFTSLEFKEFNKTERSAFLSIYGLLVGNKDQGNEGLIVNGYNETTKILHIEATAKDEELAVILSRMMYDELSDFYIDKSTQKHRDTYTSLSEKADSVYNALRNSDYRLAQFQDESSAFIRRQDQLKQDRLRREIQILTLLYGETLKNKETASFILSSSTPFFQLIDIPVTPLSPSSKGLVKKIFIWSGLVSFFVVIFLLLKRTYLKAVLE